MAILQALLGLLTRSAGKILNAIFGWAVRALFGRTTPKEQIFLSGLVGAAVAWPVLLLGAVFPKTGALFLAFVPLPHWLPSWIVRVVWLALAGLVPFSVGLAIATKAPSKGQRESFVKRLLRGFPITVGLAAAFLIMFVSVPVMRFWALVKKQVSADVPIVTDTDGYHAVAQLALAVLNRHGFGLRQAVPGWWVRAPIRLLSWFGGEAFRAFVPQKLEHFRSPQLEISFYPSGAVLRGEAQRTTWAHGLLAEAVVHSPGLQTFAAEAQDLERQIRRIWKVFDEEPVAHAHSRRLLGRTRELAEELAKIDVSFEDWQVLYRQILQLERAIDGERQLLDQQPRPGRGDTKMSKESTESNKSNPVPEAQEEVDATIGAAMRRPLEPLSTPQLVKEVTGQTGLLMKKQLDLAISELRSDLSSELAMVGGFGIAAVTSILGLAVLLMAGVFGLATLMAAWQAALIVAGALLLVAAIAGLIGWSKRARSPLSRSRKSIKESVEWTKEKLA